MGHATQAYVVARLLHRIVALTQGTEGVLSGASAALVEQAYRLAFRIAMNRIVAGVHFEVDLWAGRRLGLAIADSIAALAGDAVGAAPLDPALDPYQAAADAFAPMLGLEERGAGPLSAGTPLFKVAFEAALGEWQAGWP
jgi:hypothetical protein